MTKPKSRRIGRIFSALFSAISILLVLIGFLLYFSAVWYVEVYGQLGFDSILYTLFSNLNGVQSGLIEAFVEAVIPKTLAWSLVVCLPLFFRSSRKATVTFFRKWKLRLYPVHPVIGSVAGIILSVCLIFNAGQQTELFDYLYNLIHQSTLYENEYRDPKDVTITFPEEKRNLIYIMLESMETSYLSTEEGGALPYNAIPELYQLAQENITFSHTDKMGGAYNPASTHYTIASMVAQTAGIPFRSPGFEGDDYGLDGSFLPGVTSITDVLHENGYYQALMFGSDANFAGRRQYYKLHGMDDVYDYYTAFGDEILSGPYFVWWGMEDQRLFEYAKLKLPELAAMDQPFAFTMLTVDTHHIGGYFCELCENVHEEQYENVISCSSRQVYDFIQWLQQQDFYENTTVVIVGDHLSMDAGYFTRNVSDDYERRTYNCFLNAAVSTDNTLFRQFAPMDMFPTTLAAMGCTIEGERLGLGTNLFSSTPTLMEVLGKEAFDAELAKYSYYYADHFYYAQ